MKEKKKNITTDFRKKKEKINVVIKFILFSFFLACLLLYYFNNINIKIFCCCYNSFNIMGYFFLQFNKFCKKKINEIIEQLSNEINKKNIFLY